MIKWHKTKPRSSFKKRFFNRIYTVLRVTLVDDNQNWWYLILIFRLNIIDLRRRLTILVLPRSKKWRKSWINMDVAYRQYTDNYIILWSRENNNHLLWYEMKNILFLCIWPHLIWKKCYHKRRGQKKTDYIYIKGVGKKTIMNFNLIG